MGTRATFTDSDSAAERAIGAAWRALAPTIPGAPLDVRIDVVTRTGSTNSDLLSQARTRAPLMPAIRIALEQTAGRGRLGRTWQAPAGSAILMSVAVPLARPMVEGAVTLACGVGAAESLRAAQVPAQLKWPNDVLLDGRKLAGLLAELAVDSGGTRTLVVGMGLNLVRAGAAPRDTPNRAVLADAIAIDDVDAAHCLWSVRLAAAMIVAIRSVERDGFALFVQRFNALFAWRGKSVVVLDPHRRHETELISGIAVGVNTAGQLQLDTGGTIVSISSGDVSLRAAAGAPLH